MELVTLPLALPTSLIPLMDLMGLGNSGAANAAMPPAAATFIKFLLSVFFIIKNGDGGFAEFYCRECIQGLCTASSKKIKKWPPEKKILLRNPEFPAKLEL